MGKSNVMNNQVKWWILWLIAVVSMISLLYIPASLLYRVIGVWGIIMIYGGEALIGLAYMLVNAKKESSSLDKAMYFLEVFSVQSAICMLVIIQIWLWILCIYGIYLISNFF